MSIKEQFVQEVQLATAECIKQLFGTSERTAYLVVGLRSLYYHIKSERARLTWAIKKKVLIRYNWTCLYPGCGVRNPWGQHKWLAKIEVDHVVSLKHYGTSDESNLQTLCSYHNRLKGIRDADYRR